MPKSLSERLKRAIEDWKRAERGRSIMGFHRILAEQKVRGSSYAMIHHYLRGEWEPGMAFLVAAADVLDVRQQWLVSGEGAQTVADAAMPRTAGVSLDAVLVTGVEAQLRDLAGDLGLEELRAVRRRLVASCKDGHKATPSDTNLLGDWLGRHVLEPLERLDLEPDERQGEDYVRAACLALTLAMPENRAGPTIGKLIERLED